MLSNVLKYKTRGRESECGGRRTEIDGHFATVLLVPRYIREAQKKIGVVKVADS